MVSGRNVMFGYDKLHKMVEKFRGGPLSQLRFQRLVTRSAAENTGRCREEQRWLPVQRQRASWQSESEKTLVKIQHLPHVHFVDHTYVSRKKCAYSAVGGP